MTRSGIFIWNDSDDTATSRHADKPSATEPDDKKNCNETFPIEVIDLTTPPPSTPVIKPEPSLSSYSSHWMERLSHGRDELSTLPLQETPNSMIYWPSAGTDINRIDRCDVDGTEAEIIDSYLDSLPVDSTFVPEETSYLPPMPPRPAHSAKSTSTAATELQHRLTSAIARGSDLEAALEATKLAYKVLEEKKQLEIRLTKALEEQARLQKALEDAQAMRRYAVVAAEELMHTNNCLNVMTSDLQAHMLNQQEEEVQAAKKDGLMMRRTYQKPDNGAVMGSTTYSWTHSLWLSVGYLHPVLQAAESTWCRDGKVWDAQGALLCLRAILGHRQLGIAVEKNAQAPLSGVGVLAMLLRCTIQIVAEQPRPALRVAENMVHESRAYGLKFAEGVAQWVRGHALLALDRPREAGLCFGYCGASMPDEAIRRMRAESNAQVQRLPPGHAGRELSDEFVQFYKQYYRGVQE